MENLRFWVHLYDVNIKYEFFKLILKLYKCITFVVT